METIKEYEDVFFKSLLRGNRFECEKIMKDFRKSNLSIIKLYEDVFMKSLYRIGKMWEYNKITVSVEHMSTSITEGLMNELFPEIMSLERKNKKIIIACIENEEHQVGGKMVADIFEKNSWDTHYLGANTPINELVEFCNLVRPDMIGLSLSVYANVLFLIKEIKAIREVTDVPIIVGGQALKNISSDICEKFENVTYLGDLNAVENYIKGCD